MTAEDVDTYPLPTEFVAYRVNVYEVPFVRPESVADVPVVVVVNPPGLDVSL